MSKIKTDNTQVIINMQNVIDEQQKQIDSLKNIISKMTSAASDCCDPEMQIELDDRLETVVGSK